MLYFTIIISIVTFFILLLVLYNFNLKRNKKRKKIEIIYDDINSFNVSKIVKIDNDLDFIRNNFWYSFKQKKIINKIAFYELKKQFELTNDTKITDLISNIKDSKEMNLSTDSLIQIVISDNNTKEELAHAFYLLEKQL